MTLTPYRLSARSSGLVAWLPSGAWKSGLKYSLRRYSWWWLFLCTLRGPWHRCSMLDPWVWCDQWASLGFFASTPSPLESVLPQLYTNHPMFSPCLSFPVASLCQGHNPFSFPKLTDYIWSDPCLLWPSHSLSFFPGHPAPPTRYKPSFSSSSISPSLRAWHFLMSALLPFKICPLLFLQGSAWMTLSWKGFSQALWCLPRFCRLLFSCGHPTKLWD